MLRCVFLEVDYEGRYARGFSPNACTLDGRSAKGYWGRSCHPGVSLAPSHHIAGPGVYRYASIGVQVPRYSTLLIYASIQQ